MNTFGNKLRVTVFGESHGPAVGVVMGGVKPGIPLAESDFAADLFRRKSGAQGTTARRETDEPEILSGVYNGFTTGAPLTVIFRNEDIRSLDYEAFKRHPRPSHADWTAAVKYDGYNDPRGGGHFSGRLTVALVAAGVVAKKMLGDKVVITCKISEIGGTVDPYEYAHMLGDASGVSDSLGGVLECVAEGVPAGLGEPFFDSVESMISHIMFAIPGVRGVEFGTGFRAAAMRGSEHNDPIIDTDGTTASNHAGGINGGITNGNTLTIRVAVKPTSSIGLTQHTINMESGQMEPLIIGGRHDACIALRMPVIVEAAVAIALAQF